MFNLGVKLAKEVPPSAIVAASATIGAAAAFGTADRIGQETEKVRAQVYGQGPQAFGASLFCNSFVASVGGTIVAGISSAPFIRGGHSIAHKAASMGLTAAALAVGSSAADSHLSNIQNGTTRVRPRPQVTPNNPSSWAEAMHNAEINSHKFKKWVTRTSEENSKGGGTWPPIV